MKAIIFERYGGPEELKLKEIPAPVAADDEVLVKVYATSINDWDHGILKSETLMDRLMNGWKRPKRTILGSDIAGRVEAVGKDIKKFKVGDEVYGDLSGRWGGFAEYVTAKEKMLALKPAGMSYEAAAAIPQAAMLAVQALIDRGNMKPDQTLLINGAGGGVGTFGIQIAKQYNVAVTCVDKGTKLDMLRSMGSDTIDYTKENIINNGRRYDLALDVRTDRPILQYLRTLNPNGTYVTVGGSVKGILHIFLLGPWIRLFTGKKMRVVMLRPNKDLPYINQLYNEGKIRSVIDGHYTLSQTPEAFERFEKADQKGKLVITIADPSNNNSI